MSRNSIQVSEWEPVKRNQPSPVHQKHPQERKSGSDLRQQNLVFWRKGPAPCCYRNPWKVAHDKHWYVSAIWLSSLQRFLNWWQLTDLGKPRKCTVSTDSLTGHLHGSSRSRALLPRCARGQQGRFWEQDAHLFSSFWDGLLLSVTREPGWVLGRMSDWVGLQGQRQMEETLPTPTQDHQSSFIGNRREVTV